MDRRPHSKIPSIFDHTVRNPSTIESIYQQLLILFLRHFHVPPGLPCQPRGILTPEAGGTILVRDIQVLLSLRLDKPHLPLRGQDHEVRVGVQPTFP